jgi:hypothetical protein
MPKGSNRPTGKNSLNLVTLTVIAKSSMTKKKKREKQPNERKR